MSDEGAQRDAERERERILAEERARDKRTAEAEAAALKDNAS